jgi:TonB family protein
VLRPPVATAPIPVPGSPLRPMTGWLVPLWLCGVGLLLARLAMGHARVLFSLRRSEKIRDTDWLTLLVETSGRIGLRRRVDLRSSGETDIPLSYGLFRYAVVFPAGSDEWSLDRRRVVLTHELIHVQRRDSLSYLIAQLACASYWFHPLAWFALSRFRQEQERSCDDAVVRAGTGQAAYAEHLVNLARSVAAVPSKWSAALGMAEACDLEQRVHALLDPGRNRGALSRGVCLAALSAIVACIIPLAAVRAQNSEPRAQLSGSVYDPSGAAIPHAMVMLKNVDRTNQEITRAGADGAFHFDRIVAGTYNVEVRSPGFAMYQQAGVTLHSGTTEQLNVRLDIGQISENVEVVGKGPLPQSTGAPRRIRVGGNVQATKLLSAVKPIYPADAQSSGTQGTVLLRAVISREGNLLGVSAINTSADPALAKAAIDAVQQWRYQPTLLNGVPVEVITTINVNFRLEQ